MNQQSNQLNVQDTEENVLFGVIGAFLFSLVGGALYVILNMVGYIAALSGLIGVVCAIKGYAFFSKKESKRGIIISVVVAAVVLIIAWYVGFCMDMVDAYKMWYENGEVDYAPTFFEYLPYGIIDLTVNLGYFWNLLLSLGLGALGCWSYVANMLKREKAIAAHQAAQAATQAQLDAQAAQAAAAETYTVADAAPAETAPEAPAEENTPEA